MFTTVSFIDPVFLEGIKPIQLPETLLDALGPKVSLMVRIEELSNTFLFSARISAHMHRIVV